MDGPHVLRIRLLPDPPLWCWELVDRDGHAVDGSWSRDWAAWQSPAEALGAARASLGPAVRKLPCRIERAAGNDLLLSA
jgi:hypothetical protein